MRRATNTNVCLAWACHRRPCFMRFPLLAVPQSSPASREVECAVRQEAITDEQIVLRSMFPEIEEIPSTIVWGKRSHRYQFGILLKPCTGHDDAENHVAVRLVFRLPPKYPKAPALVEVGRLWTGRLSHPLSGQIRIHATAVVLQVEHIRGLSDNQLQELSRILNDHAGARVGTPCVLDICENCLSEAQGLPCSTSVPLLIRIHLTPFQTAL